jgi:hypothetical protein
MFLISNFCHVQYVVCFLLGNSPALTKEALEGFGDFKISRQIIHTVKYADDLVLMAKEDKLIKIGRCYGMEMNVEKTKVMRISRQLSPVKIMIDQKQLENVKFFKYLCSILANDGRCTCEIKCRIAMAKAAFNKKRTLFISTLDLELRKKLVKCYIWSIALYGAGTWTIRTVDQKHLESFEIGCWKRMEKISWTDHVRNEDVLLSIKEQRNILHEICKRKANWIGHILCRNCLLQRVTEGKIQGGIEVTGRQGRRHRKLLDDLKERRGYSHLKEEALDCTMWRARFGRGFGPVVRQTTK